jgi:hypothetical protein
MLIPLNEPSNFRYIYINPATNRVHLLVPFIAGLDVSTDNTCKSDLELEAFFKGGAFNELASYKSTLEFHMSLLEEGDAHYKTKKERLTQINTYLEAVVEMSPHYRAMANTFLDFNSNLYSIQLRPRVQDPMSRVVNPAFRINRGNDSQGEPLSPLYNKMHEVFPGLALGKPDPRTDLVNNVLESIPPEFLQVDNVLKRKSSEYLDEKFHSIKQALKSQCAKQFKIDINVENWIRPVPGKEGVNEPVDRTHINDFMGFNENASSKDYIDALLGVCVPNLWRMITGSPFYLGIYDDTAHQTESLSMMMQFYLGVLNIYCRAKGISDENFGVILDNSPVLSHELVDMVALALSHGEAVEPAIVAFFNHHQHEFKLSRELTSQDKDTIAQKFETTYRTVMTTKENPYMDDFMFLDTEAHGENDIFITNKGLICTDASNIIFATPLYEDYFAEIRNEARLHRDTAIPSQDEPIITIDIAPVALMDKLSDVQWERLPKEVVDACRDLPAFKVGELLHDVAKGKQDEAHTILESTEDKQALLRTPGKFIDYSGRTFRCTTYEYAYWAKDTHMQRMLERHMDDETKAFMLEKIDAMEHSGLAYQQHGVAYQNAHYDMSFVLKNFTVDEFHQLKTMVGQNHSKIQQATSDNYRNISFTATEYESLKKILEQHRPTGIFSFFYSSPATAISEKLQFDFRSLITALNTYVTNYEKWDYHQRLDAWMKVGKAQRDVPAHIAHEYCRPDRSFDPLPSFNEENLPRVLFDHYTRRNDISWFPLSSSSSSLGYAFAFIRASASGPWCAWPDAWAPVDLAAVRHLDEVRIADLTQSRENLSRFASQVRLVH